MHTRSLAALALAATCSFAAACTITSGDGDDDGNTPPATSSVAGSGAGGTTAQGGSTADGGSTASSGGMGGAGGGATCATCFDAAGGTDLDLCGDTGNGCEPNTSCALFADFIDAACGEDLESGPCATECCAGGEFPANPVDCGTCIDNTTDAAFDACLADM